MPGRRWISAWFILTAPLMLWDAGYCLMRPRSMVGGDLHWIWPVYEFYGKVDHVYGIKAFEDGEGFANAAGYTGSSMTLAKTVLYVSQEYFCGFCAIGHNALSGMLFYWILPNIAWITISVLIMYTLGGDILHGLNLANQAKSTSALSSSSSSKSTPSLASHPNSEIRTAATTMATMPTMNNSLGSSIPGVVGTNSSEDMNTSGRRGTLKFRAWWSKKKVELISGRQGGGGEDTGTVMLNEHEHDIHMLFTLFKGNVHGHRR
ncbi:hypothetical protein D9757_001590 [Collybiopsis confluens]|uniref:Uncharacterized protein n=1 Tax=Collybiopsis confluens TaxID=2823264 RepID=A0A8H5MF66_9AGAR|nr:hypothetical protein D9757_001590 [Collybiopsis confluens]